MNFVDDRITVALDVLVWLCDGQQTCMQDALSKIIKFSVSWLFYFMRLVGSTSYRALNASAAWILLAKSLSYFLE